MYEQEIMEMKDSVTAMFEDLHRHPERGFHEIRTSGIIAEYLKKCGLSVTEHVAMTGVVGILDSGRPGKTLMLRADMDCLAIKELADCGYRSEYEGKETSEFNCSFIFYDRRCRNSYISDSGWRLCADRSQWKNGSRPDKLCVY